MLKKHVLISQTWFNRVFIGANSWIMFQVYEMQYMREREFNMMDMMNKMELQVLLDLFKHVQSCLLVSMSLRA